jgi:SAM-dependent methyltransferase
MKLETTECPICGNKKYTKYISGKDFVNNIDENFTYVKCNNCSLIYQNPRMTPQSLAERLYNGKYRSQNKGNEISRESTCSRTFKIYAKLFFKLNRFPEIQKKGKVLDIGCGGCTELNSYKQAGWECFGIDPDPDVKNIGKKYGLNICIGELKEAKYHENFFDLIIMKHSLEHIPNPNEILEEVYRVLKSDGVLYIEVPNGESFEIKIFKNFWHQLHFGHLYLYSPKTLAKLLIKNQFHVIRVAHNPQPVSFSRSLSFYTHDRVTPLNKYIIPMIFPLSSFAALLRRGTVIAVYSKK